MSQIVAILILIIYAIYTVFFWRRFNDEDLVSRTISTVAVSFLFAIATVIFGFAMLTVIGIALGY